jgi:predicted adenine nucleotide alpha hydrolase (AANH) superfamily ATPase
VRCKDELFFLKPPNLFLKYFFIKENIEEKQRYFIRKNDKNKTAKKF